MTSTTGTHQHPDAAEISALTEGLLSSERTAELEEHLRRCASCSEVRASLEGIRGLLSSLPAPSPMPAEIAHRIDTALADERLREASRAGDVSRETESMSEKRVSRETALPARDRPPSDRPAGHASGTTGPGRGLRPRRRWRAAVLGAACTVVALGLGTLFLQSTDGGGNADRAADAGAAEQGTAEAASGFSRENLANRVQGLLAQAPTQEPKSLGSQSSNESSEEKEAPLLQRGASVPPCVREGVGRPEAPLATEEGTYEGTKAYLVILPSTSRREHVDAYVVESTCADKTPSAPGRVLLNRTYPRD